MRRRSVKLIGVLYGMLFAVAAYADEAAYLQDLAAWRAAHEQRLQGEEGWLTVAGLYWLHDGANRIGTDPANDLVLRAGSAPPQVGVFNFHQGAVTFRAAEGAEVKQQGRVIYAAMLTPGPGTGSAPADALMVGELTLWLHQSGERFAVRLRDPKSPLRMNFTGCKWFPANLTYRVLGRFLPYAAPKDVIMLNVMGDLERYTSPGLVQFELQEQTFQLQPVSTGKDHLFFVFRDQTSGHETYGAARFLVTEGPHDGQVLMDFNKAVNPPCAYNPYTTCPLPVKENRLPVRIEAGELQYH